MSWETLKDAVSAVVTENGNNEITGLLLKDLINENIIPQLGKNKYLGIAKVDTIPQIQESEMFYFAFEKGNYANFGGINIRKGITFLYYDSSQWIPIVLFDDLKDYAVEQIIIEQISSSYINRTSGEIVSNGSYRRTEPIEISALPTNLIQVDFGNQGGSVGHIAYYNSNVINNTNFQGIDLNAVSGTGSGVQILGMVLTPPINATHFIVSSGNSFSLKVYNLINITKLKETLLAEISKTEKLRTNIDALINGALIDVYFVPKLSFYINRTTGEYVSNGGYKSMEPLPLEFLNNYGKVSYGNQGGSVGHIAYYSSSVVSSANFLGIQNESAASNEDEQILDEVLLPPIGATHFVLSTFNTYFLKVKTLIRNIDLSAENSLMQKTLSNQYNINSFVIGEYIRRQTLEPQALSSYYRTTAIPFSDFENKKIFVSVGNQGGSVCPVAYYSSDVLIAANYVGTQIESAASNEDEQLVKIELNRPSGATHFVVSSLNSYNIEVYTLISEDKFKGIRSSGDSLQVFRTISDIYQGLKSNPFQGEAMFMQKRASLLTSIPNNSNAFLQIYAQSNGDGRIDYADAPAWFTATNGKMDDFMMFNRNTGVFAPYEKGVNTGADNNADTRHGFEIYFAKIWLDANPGKKLYCYKKTKGGTPIAETGGNATGSWNPKTEIVETGRRKLCEETVTEIKTLLNSAQSLGIILHPICILYHQGESDADIGSAAINAYPQNIKNLMSFFRGLFLTPNLPFINGQIANAYSNYSQINDVFADVNLLDENFKTVNMIGKPTNDGVHYNQESIEYLAQEMYNYYIAFNPVY